MSKEYIVELPQDSDIWKYVKMPRTGIVISASAAEAVANYIMRNLTDAKGNVNRGIGRMICGILNKTGLERFAFEVDYDAKENVNAESKALDIATGLAYQIVARGENMQLAYNRAVDLMKRAQHPYSRFFE